MATYIRTWNFSFFRELHMKSYEISSTNYELTTQLANFLEPWQSWSSQANLFTILFAQENETPIYKIDNWNKGYEIDEKTKFTINLIDNTVFADFDKGERLVSWLNRLGTSRTILSFPFVMGPTKCPFHRPLWKERVRERERGDEKGEIHKGIIGTWLRLIHKVFSFDFAST